MRKKLGDKNPNLFLKLGIKEFVYKTLNNRKYAQTPKPI